MNNEDMKSLAYTEGMNDFFLKVAFDQNPYPKNTDCWAAWRDGWLTTQIHYPTYNHRIRRKLVI